MPEEIQVEKSKLVVPLSLIVLGAIGCMSWVSVTLWGIKSDIEVLKYKTRSASVAEAK